MTSGNLGRIDHAALDPKLKARAQSEQVPGRAGVAAAVGVVSTAIILLDSGQDGAGIPIFVLPITYSILCIGMPSMLRLATRSVGMAVLNTVLLSKFVIAPILWASTVSDGLVPTYLASEPSRMTGLWVMWAELATAFAVVQLFGRRIYTRSRAPREFADHRRSNLVLVGVALVGVAVFLASPSLLSRYNFFLLSGLQEATLGSIPLAGTAVLFTDLVLVLVPVLVLYWLKRRHDADGSFHWVAMSFVAVLPAMLVFRGTSRLSVLIPTLAWLVVLVYLYPKYRRLLLSVSLVVMVGVFVVISLFKQFGYSLTEDNDAAPTLSVLEAARTANAYFSGPENMAVGIDMAQANGGNFSTATAFDDLARNTVGLAALSTPSATTTVQFNQLIYGVSGKTDQIVPLAIQSRVYFGPLGTTLLLGVSLYLMMRFDRRAQEESRLEYKYVFVYVTVYLSMGVMTSAGSIFPLLTNFLLPILLVYKVNDLAGSRSRRRSATGALRRA